MKTKIFRLLRLVIVSLVVGLISIKLADLGLLAYFMVNLKQTDVKQMEQAA